MTTPVVPAAPAAPQAAQPTPDTPPAGQGQDKPADPPPPAKKYKVKVDGVESEVDESELVSGYQRASASNKRSMEAAKVQQQAQAILDAFKKDPAGTMRQLGMNPQEFAETFLKGHLQEQMLTPEQRRAKEMETKLKQLEDEKRQGEERQRQAQFQQQLQATKQNLINQMIPVLQQAGLPNTEMTLARTASLMQQYVRAGLQPDLAVIVPMVRDQYIADIKALAGHLDGDSLLQIFGDEVGNKIRKRDLAKLRAERTSKTDTKPAEPRSRNEAPKKFMSTDEWRESIRRARGE